MTDYTQEQDMEIEALEAILMDEFKEVHSGETGLSTSNRCFQITISQDEDSDGLITNPAQLALFFSHTERYPDEPPLLNVKSLQGIPSEDLRILKEKLQQEASENLGMAMIYTLVTSAKEWLDDRFSEDNDGNAEAEEAAKDDIVVPHGEPVTVDTFLAWRERYEAELALERAKWNLNMVTEPEPNISLVVMGQKMPFRLGSKVTHSLVRQSSVEEDVGKLMPEAVLSAPKEKKLTGRQWFESGRAKGASAVTEEPDEEDEEDSDIDFDDEDFEDDEEDMLEHYLAEKSDSSTHSSRIAS